MPGRPGKSWILGSKSIDWSLKTGTVVEEEEEEEEASESNQMAVLTCGVSFLVTN